MQLRQPYRQVQHGENRGHKGNVVVADHGQGNTHQEHGGLFSAQDPLHPGNDPGQEQHAVQPHEVHGIGDIVGHQGIAAGQQEDHQGIFPALLFRVRIRFVVGQEVAKACAAGTDLKESEEVDIVRQVLQRNEDGQPDQGIRQVVGEGAEEVIAQCAGHGEEQGVVRVPDVAEGRIEGHILGLHVHNEDGVGAAGVDAFAGISQGHDQDGYKERQGHEGAC